MAANGAIDFVQAPNGAIGSSTSTVNIWAKTAIQRVDARQIWANIDARRNGGDPANSQVWRVSATNGDFTGSINARRLDGSTNATPGLFVPNGNLNADITLTDALRRPISVSGSLPNGRVISMVRSIGDNGIMNFGSVAGRIEVTQSINRSITVAGALTGQIVIGESIPNPYGITVGSIGGTGQIIVNATNTTGTWTGPVTVGPSGSQIVLDDGASQPYQAPYYAALSSTLGGGSVGLVPYGLHKEDCEPSHAPDGGPNLYWASKTWPQSFGGQTRETFVIKHYGPVFAASSGPYLIERRKFAIAMCGSEPCAGQDLVWVDRTTMFDVYAPGSGSREVWVAMKNDGQGNPVEVDKNHAYRFSLVADSGVTRLQSDQTLVTTTPKPTVVGYPYEVKPLFFDLNQNLVADLGDIEMWMEEPADVDYSGQIDTEDLIRLIEVVGM